MKSFVEQVKRFCDRGVYKKAQIDAMYAAGKITQAEYEFILGGNDA